LAEFLNFLLGPEGQLTVERDGAFLPLNSEMVAAQAAIIN